MKYLATILYLFLCFLLNAQECNEEKHSINDNDSWTSCQMMESPNFSGDFSHWLMYDLGHVYNLSSTKFWNYNKKGETDKGLKEIKIEISVDGVSWSVVSEFTLMEAPGDKNYTGQEGPDLTGINTRYILISSTVTWGHSCAGLSEVKFDVGDVSTDTYDLYADDDGISIYPNPTSGVFVIKGELENFDIKILNISGNEVYNYSDVASLITIDISSLSDGLYFISIFHKTNKELSIQKILKQSE